MRQAQDLILALFDFLSSLSVSLRLSIALYRSIYLWSPSTAPCSSSELRDFLQVSSAFYSKTQNFSRFVCLSCLQAGEFKCKLRKVYWPPCHIIIIHHNHYSHQSRAHGGVPAPMHHAPRSRAPFIEYYSTQYWIVELPASSTRAPEHQVPDPLTMTELSYSGPQAPPWGLHHQ